MFAEFRQDRVFLRPQTGAYEQNGKYDPDAAPIPIPIIASLQPLTPKELQQLPEGRRTNISYKMYTDTEIKTVNHQKPDEIIIGIRIFEATGIENWNNNIINHYKVIIVATNREYTPP